MTNKRYSFGRLAPLAILGLVATVQASPAPLEVHKNDVIPVRFDDQLSTSTNRPGDPFSARPETSDLFPRGTEFEGHVVHVSQKTPRHPASMDLAFDDVRFPDGSRREIEGVPIPLTSKYVERDRDGHYVAKPAVRKDTAVGVGAIAGFIVGSIFHRPFEGTFLGTLGGILVASSAGDDSVLVINKDAEAGVLFQHSIVFDGIDAAGGPPPRDLPPVGDPSLLNVRIGDRNVQYTADQAPYKEGSTVMVPIQVTAKQLGLNYDESESSIFAENDTHSLRFEQNSTGYRIDGRSDVLPSTVVQRGGVWYAPASAFDAVLGH